MSIDLTKKYIESNKHYKYIYHISDVHIRLYKWHSYYRQVFANLIEYISSDIKLHNEDSIICITGDLVHNKTDINPECVDLLTELLQSLSRITEVVCIPGNHDGLIHNRHRLDSITPVINAMNSPNIIFSKYSEVVEIANLNFIHHSVFDDIGLLGQIVNYTKPSNDITSIGLYHGSINNCYSEDGVFKMTGLDLQLFQNYDMTLLGDIHKPNQILSKSKNIGYPGSLSQQKSTECIYPEHGILKWNVDTKTSEFIEIDSPYGYLQLYFNNNKLIKYYGKYNSNLYIKAILQNSTQDAALKYIHKIKNKYNFNILGNIDFEKEVNRINSSNLDEAVSFDVNSISFQNTMIALALSNEEPERINAICDLNKALNHSIESINTTHSLTWEPISFEWDHLFAYGENNKIEFTSLSGINGIFAKNASGKSSIFNSILFCIFDKCPVSSKISTIINRKSNSFKCKFKFRIGDIIYIIERSGERNKWNKVPVEVKFYYIDDYGNIVNLTGEQRADTNKKIRDYLGTYDNFIMTTILSQGDNSGFLSLKSSARTDLYIDFLNIKIFSELYTLSNKKINTIQSEINANYSLIKNINLTKIEEDLKEKDELINDVETRIVELENEYVTLSNTLALLKSELNESDIELIDNASIVAKLNKERELLNTYNNKINNLQIESNELSNKITEYHNKYTDLVIEKINTLYNEYVVLGNQKNTINSKLSKLTLIKTHLAEKISAVGQFKSDCDFCKNTPFIKELSNYTIELNSTNESISALTNELNNIEQDINSKLNIVNIYKTYCKDKESNASNINLIRKTNESIIELNSNITRVNNSIKELNNKLLIYDTNKKIIEKNKKIQLEIPIITKNMAQLQHRLVDYKHKNNEYYFKKSSLLSDIATYNNAYTNITNLSKELELYELYSKIMHRDNIPLMIIQKTIPLLENKINSILSDIVDFSISIEIEEFDIDVYIQYGDERWLIETASGMEKFITSLAFRTAFVKIANIPHSNFIVIDEGFGVLDSDHLSVLPELFNKLKNMFDFILLVSHIDVMGDMIDGLITINVNQNNTSHIFLS